MKLTALWLVACHEQKYGIFFSQIRSLIMCICVIGRGKAKDSTDRYKIITEVKYIETGIWKVSAIFVALRT